MALGTTCTALNSNFAYSGKVCVATNQDNKNIYTTFINDRNARSYVKMQVTVYDSARGAYRTVETKYLGLLSGSKSKNTTWYNYSTAGTRTFRVSFYMYQYSNYTGHLLYGTSASWQR